MRRNSLVPPARGVIVNAAALPAGFLTVKTELTDVVSTKAIPTICNVPVALPATVYDKSAPLSVNNNWPIVDMVLQSFGLPEKEFTGGCEAGYLQNLGGRRFCLERAT